MSIVLQFKNDTVEDIRKLFLSIAEINRSGFFTPLDDILEFLGKYEGLTEKQKAKLKNHIIERILNRYGFKNGTEYQIFVDEKDKRKKHYLFTDTGFKMMCMAMPGAPKGHLIIEYYLTIEEDYLKRLDAAEDENRKIYNEIVEYADKIREVIKITEQKKDEAIHLVKLMDEEEKSLDISESRVNNKYDNDDDYSTQIDIHKSQYKIDLDELSFEEYYTLMLIKTIYMKPIYIVIIDSKTLDNLAKKKNKASEQTKAADKRKQQIMHDDDDITDSEIDEEPPTELTDNSNFIDLDYDMGDLPSETEPAFYSIMSKLPTNRERLAAILYVEKRKGKDALVAHLNDEKNKYKTIKDGVWMISLQDIRDWISVDLVATQNP